MATFLIGDACSFDRVIFTGMPSERQTNTGLSVDRYPIVTQQAITHSNLYSTTNPACFGPFPLAALPPFQWHMSATRECVKLPT